MSESKTESADSNRWDQRSVNESRRQRAAVCALHSTTRGGHRSVSVAALKIAAGLLFLATPGMLHATEPSTVPSSVAPETREEAARLNSRGIELYKKQQFGLAVEQLRAAYRLDPDPSIVCNLARAQYKLQPGAAAAASLEKCLATDTTLSDSSRQTLESYLRDARERAASEESEPAPAPLLAPAVAAPAASTPAAVGRPLWRLALGGGLVAAGAGMLIGGSAAWAVNGQCATPDPPCERIYKTEPGGAASVILGTAALASGVVLLALPAARPRGSAAK